jgi:predicted MFS family arabinose efflux permease
LPEQDTSRRVVTILSASMSSGDDALQTNQERTHPGPPTLDHARALRFVGSGVAAYVAATVSWWLQPQLIETLIRGLRISSSLAGVVAGAEMGATALITIGFGLVVGRLRRSLRSIALAGVAIAFAGHAASVILDDLPLLIGARILAGIGEGLILGSGNAALAGSVEPDRRIAQVLSIYVMCGSLLILLGPFASDMHAQRGLFALFACLTVLIGAWTALLPQRAHSTTLSMHPAHSWQRASIALVAGMGLWSMVGSSAWAFSAVIGQHCGLNPHRLTLYTASAAWAAPLGGLLAAFLGTRFGRLTPVLMALVTEIGAIYALSHWFRGPVYLVTLCTLFFVSYFVQPYILGMASTLDRNGGVAASAAGAYRLGGFIGPIFGGLLIQRFHGETGLTVGAVAVLPLVIYLFASGNQTVRAKGSLLSS